MYYCVIRLNSTRFYIGSAPSASNPTPFSPVVARTLIHARCRWCMHVSFSFNSNMKILFRRLHFNVHKSINKGRRIKWPIPITTISRSVSIQQPSTSLNQGVTKRDKMKEVTLPTINCRRSKLKIITLARICQSEWSYSKWNHQYKHWTNIKRISAEDEIQQLIGGRTDDEQ